MKIELILVGDIEVEYGFDIVDVYSSCNDISRNEDIELILPEAVHDAVPSALTDIAVKGIAGYPVCLELS